jgi:hypothetical protein
MRFSGNFRQNFFYEMLKANGRAGFSHSPVFDFVSEPGKQAGAQRMQPTLRQKK